MSTTSTKSKSQDIALCVDLDGTLIRSDSLSESCLLVIKQKPWLIFSIGIWLLKGKAYFKQQISKHSLLNAASLPYNAPLLKYLTQQKELGRHLVLCTAADNNIAREVANFLNIFDEVIASNGVSNNSGPIKTKNLVSRFGPQGFDYAGNGVIDLSVWRQANKAILVDTPKDIIEHVKRHTPIDHIFSERKNPFKILLRALRIHQWVKNILIFVPIFTAHGFFNLSNWRLSIVAFFSFSLGASSVYLINDLFDLESDRKHAKKRFRPLASGDLSLLTGFALIFVLITASGVLATTLPKEFLYVFGFYYVATLLYSSYIKQWAIIDVILLAALYTTRVVTGHVVTGLPYSSWLIAFSMFIFLSLAFLKRVSELQSLKRLKLERSDRRGYFAGDLEQLASLGASSGYISVLVLALYINSLDVIALYKNPLVLWAICPLFLYWISRMWLFAHRGQMDEDPILFALKDKVSYMVVMLIAAIVLLAI